jgi:hypothetical protein
VDGLAQALEHHGAPEMSRLGMTTTNSSPPNRPIRSSPRRALRPACAKALSTSSPTLCPSWSLIDLKWSMSMSASTKPASPAAPAVELRSRELEDAAPVGKAGEVVAHRQGGEAAVLPALAHHIQDEPRHHDRGEPQRKQEQPPARLLNLALHAQQLVLGFALARPEARLQFLRELLVAGSGDALVRVAQQAQRLVGLVPFPELGVHLRRDVVVQDITAGELSLAASSFAASSAVRLSRRRSR